MTVPAGSAAGKSSGSQPRLTATRLSSPEDWRALLSEYSHIVFVANSDECRLDTLVPALPDTTLYVFFNKVYKVLDRPFEGNALLVARSSSVGANIVYRREVGDVLRFFAPGRFRGILNLKAHSDERLSAVDEFGISEVGHLDLAAYFADFYPQGRVPTSGFALAVWLCELDIGRPITLTGFSARRSEQWKLFHEHDWTFEQILIRLFVRLGKLGATDTAEASPYAVLQQRFPDIRPADVIATATEVLAERLDGANHELDRLISLTRFNRAVHNFSRWLKPKTRKQKIAEARKKLESGDDRAALAKPGKDEDIPSLDGDSAEGRGAGKK